MNIVSAVLIFLELVSFFFLFFTYYLFKRFTFILVRAENLGEGSSFVGGWGGELFQPGELQDLARECK